MGHGTCEKKLTNGAQSMCSKEPTLLTAKEWQYLPPRQYETNPNGRLRAFAINFV